MFCVIALHEMRPLCGHPSLKKERLTYSILVLLFNITIYEQSINGKINFRQQFVASLAIGFIHLQSPYSSSYSHQAKAGVLLEKKRNHDIAHTRANTIGQPDIVIVS